MYEQPVRANFWIGLAGWFTAAVLQVGNAPAWSVWVFAGCAALAWLAALYNLEFVHSRLPEWAKFPEFSVRVTAEDVQPWGHSVYIAAARVRVTNHTGRPKTIMDLGVSQRTQGAPGALADPNLNLAMMNKGTQYDTHMQSSRVEPHDHLNRWRVFHLAIPPEGGRPAYEVGVRDELGRDYRCVQKAKKGRQRTWTTL